MKKHSSIFLKITTFAVWLTCMMGGAFAQTPADSGTHNVFVASACGKYTWSANEMTYHASGVYTHAYTNTDGYASVDTLKLTIHPLPNVVAHTHAPRICKGQNVVLTAEADIPCSFSWGSAGSGQPIEVWPKKTTTYRVTAVDSIHGCQAKASIKVEVEAVKIAASPSLKVCEGENVTLTASGAIEYYWFLADPQTTASVTVNESGTYIVQGVHNGCNTHDTVVVTVYPKPAFTINGYNEMCPEESSISLTASSTQNYQYEWGDGQTSASIEVTTAGIYTVTGRDEHGCTNTISKTVTASSYPIITISGNDTACKGNPITLQATNASSCEWKNSFGVTIGTGPQIEVTPTETTEYWVYGVVENQRCPGKGMKLVRVKAVPEVSIMGDTLVCVGSSQTLVASARYPGFVTFVWPGHGTGTSISVTQNEPQTTYTLVGIAGNGCRGTATKTIRTRKGVGQRERLTICGQNYPWRGLVFFNSGVYISPFATTDENGCTCYDTLDLTLNYNTGNAVAISESEFYTWPRTGVTYYYSGNYTSDEYLNDNGCPTVDTLHLRIINDEVFQNNCMIYGFMVKEESCDPGHDGVVKLSVDDAAMDDFDIEWDFGNGESSSALVVGELSSGAYPITVRSKTCPDVIYYQDVITVTKESGCDDNLSVTINGPTSASAVCKEAMPSLTYTISISGGTPPYSLSGNALSFQYTPPEGHSVISRTVTDSKGRTATGELDVYARREKCSIDPNEITGPEGYDEEKHYVNATDKMNYRIDFENDPDFATAPASRVRITYDVPAEQNMASFRLGEFSFGSFIYTVPSNVTSYYQRLDVSDSLGVWVDVTAGIDVMNHQLFWIFQSIDPATGAEPVNSQMGFLSINDSVGHGEGYVTFNILPKNTVATGDTVAVDASIVFDDNAPIGTNVWGNTFDAVAPSSTLHAEMNELDSLYCTFTFAAQDDANGSGVKEVEVFVSKNNGTYQSLGITHPDSSLVYALENGMYYQFMSIATDNVGNKEPLKALPDTTVNYNTAPSELVLSGNTFYEYDPRYTLIGTLSTVDDDMSQPFVYTLVSGEGDDDNNLFTIEGNSLKTDTTFVCSRNYDYYVRIRTTDFGGMYYEKSFRLKEIRQHITPTVNIPKTLCEGESLTFFDTLLTTEGDYTKILQTPEGCDSIVVWFVTMSPSYHNAPIDTTVCDAFEWNDSIYTESAVITHTYTLPTGCDSTVTYNLTVHYSTHNVKDTVVCGNYEWHNLTCDTTGVYTYEYANLEGCSSIDTLYLTVNQPTFGDTTVITDSPFTWYDSTYTVTPNIAPTHTFTNAAGCDSVVTLHLTINQPTFQNIVTVTSASAPAPIVYDGATHGDEYQSYTVTFDGNPVAADDASGLLFTLPSGDVLTVTPTFTGVTNVYDANDTANNNVFTYSITNPSLYTATTTTTYGTVNLVPRPITISSDTSKAYDGTPFEISYNQLNVSNIVTGESLTSGTVTSESYHVGEYTCTDGAFNHTMALAATQSGFEVSSGKANYAPTFNTKLTITGRNLTITAGNAQKTYDGSDLTSNDFTTNGLASTDIVNATVGGLQRCVGESASTITSYTVTNGSEDVTGDYNIITVPGTLKVTPVTTGFSCPDNVSFSLAEGVTEITLTDADLNGPATLSPAVAGAYVENNLATLNPFAAGIHNVKWTLYDECGHVMTTCNQLVTVGDVNDDCLGTLTYMGHSYAYKRIGSQCWFTENLRAEIGTDYHAYNDDPTNLTKFGYLYSWYTAVGVTEGDNSAVPETHTATDGTSYVQGICPPGWAIPSQADVALLNTTVGDVDMLKEPSTEYWQSGFEGTGGSGFNARAGGRYNDAMSRYEDIMTGFHFWQSNAPTGSISVVSACIAYYCSSVLVAEPNLKSDRKSVRCLRKIPN